MTSLRAALLAAFAALAAAGAASAQTMTTSNPVNNTMGVNNLFNPHDWGTMLVAPASGAPQSMIFGIAEAGYFPQFSAGASPSAPPYSANGFFGADQYAADCGTGLWIIQSPTMSKRLCKVTSAPVVDAATFPARLSAAGLRYKIVYPVKDNGNGRAYIVWNSMDACCVGNGAQMMSTAGYARIENAGWQNQFAYAAPFFPQYSTGDMAGDFISGLPSPLRETTLRLEVPMYILTIGTSRIGINATMVADDWLGETSPPPPPPVQVVADPTAPAPPVASPVNLGGTGVGAGSGVSTPGSADAVGGKAVDWDAYCRSATLSNGKPQSDFWIQGCLGQAH